jgi:hypothetical protein
MLTVELHNFENADPETIEVEVYCDQEGLSVLSKQLEHLRTGSTHVHLMSPAWAGNELDERAQGVDTVVVHHLRISLKQQ